MSRVDRFKGAVWFNSPLQTKLSKILIGGIGGIGSWTAVLLNRAGFTPICFDDDSVEEYNLGGQLYLNNAVGQSKINALSEIIGKLGFQNRFNGFSQKIHKDTPISYMKPIVISAFDNMLARKTLLDLWLKNLENYSEEEKAMSCFIDGRLDFGQMQIYYVRPEDVEEYKKHIVDDASIPDGDCTMKQTSFMAAIISGIIVNTVTMHIQFCIEEGIKPNFYTEYCPTLNMFKNESR